MIDLSVLPPEVAEICVIAPSPALVENTRRICLRNGMENVQGFVAVLDDGMRMAELVRQRGARVLVSRKGTASLLDRHCDLPVVKINTTINDYLRHINLMQRHSGRLGIVEYESYIPELKKLCQYIGIEDARLYSYGNSTEYEQVVQQAIADATSGKVTILLGGGSLLPPLTQKLGIPHTVVENTEESIEIALHAAQQMLRLQKEEELKRQHLGLLTERYSTVLHFSHDGILAMDRQGIITVMNPVARRLLDVNGDDCIGQHAAKVIPGLNFQRMGETGQPVVNQVLKTSHALLSANMVPILLNGRFEGAVLTLQNGKEIQESEQKIRLELHERGLVAKYDFDDIIGVSPSIGRAKTIARRYAAANSTVLISGDTGVGKELFAQSIHNNSQRAQGPFVAINCAALNKDLLESQLFGYVEGAFTGALKGGRAGLFEVAHGGTIFLDEIGEIPIETQVQLLRVLQEKEIRRLGSDRILPVDVRVICATNRDLAREVACDRFRRDLFYRINVLKLEIPPLRERREDIELIVEKYLRRTCPEQAEAMTAYMKKIYPRLSQYDWPGNIRELLGLTERIVTLVGGDPTLELESSLLMERISVTTPIQELQPPPPLLEDDNGRDRLLEALRINRFSRVKTAAYLGVSRSTLWRYLRRHGLDSCEEAP